MNAVENALRFVDANDRDVWLRVGMALHKELGADGRSVWDAWAAQSPKFDERSQRAACRGFKSGRGVGIGSLFKLARDSGWSGSVQRAEQSSPHQRFRWKDHLSVEPPSIPACCIIEDSTQPLCQHWRAFDAQMMVAKIRADLREAAAEVVALFETAIMELTAAELRDNLLLSVDCGGIETFNMNPQTIRTVIAMMVNEVVVDGPDSRAS